MPRTTSGRVRFRCSLHPSSAAPPKSSAVRLAACSIVPMAPSSTRTRRASASRRSRMTSHSSAIGPPGRLSSSATLSAMTSPALSLEGIRVVDCSRVLAGPFCGMLLSDLGADVIKVEDTGSGDESRTWPPHKDGESAAFMVINRNKRDMTLDLKQPEGVEILKRLAGRADVLIENFRTGTMESFGLGYDTLSAANPGLVYASV